MTIRERDLPKELQIAEGVIEARRGEGLLRTLNKANWGSDTPTAASIASIIKFDDANETDVKTTWVPSGTASISTTYITLPEIVVPSNAELGKYLITFSFEDSANSPGLPYAIIEVFK